MKKIIIAIILVVAIAGIFIKYSRSYEIKDKVNNENINVVTSLEDKIGDNTAWCGTFNLIWNDLKNDIAKQDIKFASNSVIVDNLNKGTFTTSALSESSYYKTYGTPTLELKAEIEKAIKEKFNETSDILDSFRWEGHTEEDYFLYSMLKKDFEYEKEFEKLENGTFGKYTNVKFFGINGRTKNEVREQVEILYYNSGDDFAFKIDTKGNDEIIVTVGNKEDNFLDIYNSIMKEHAKYDGGNSFRNNDTLKMPYISFDLKEEITEVENKPFYLSNGKEYIIEKALQTIQFDLDEKGGRIKSEAGMMVNKATSIRPQEPRRLNVDQPFTIFLIEEGKSLPYFAAKITDISSVQGGVEFDEKYKENVSGEEKSNSTQAYIPDGMQIPSKDDVITKTEEITFNRDKEKVTIEVLSDSVSQNGLTIVITDKNEHPYGWGKSYKIQQKSGDEWKDLIPITEMYFEEIAYVLDENGQYKQNIDWSKFYGELEKGIYRVVKDTYDKGYVYFYSNEFEI